jgi:hypothetical protein
MSFELFTKKFIWNCVNVWPLWSKHTIKWSVLYCKQCLVSPIWYRSLWNWHHILWLYANTVQLAALVLLQTSQCLMHDDCRYCCKHLNVCCMMTAATAANIMMSTALWLQVLLQTSWCLLHYDHSYCSKHHDVYCIMTASTAANIMMSAALWPQVLPQTSQCLLYNDHRYCCKHPNVCCIIITRTAANITMSAAW